MTDATTVAVEGGLTLRTPRKANSGFLRPCAPAGPTDSWHAHEPVLERLPRSIRAIAVSQRGHGDSDQRTTSTTRCTSTFLTPALS